MTADEDGLGWFSFRLFLGFAVSSWNETFGQQHRVVVELGDTFWRVMKIPIRFARRFGNNFSNVVCLNMPSGDVWKMKLRRQKDDFWLQDGWSDFVKHYSIEDGYFLVFRYEGNCVFHVVVCDTSASEITYPMVCKANCGKFKLGDERLLSQDVEETEDMVIEISDDDSQSCRCKRRESPSSTKVRSPKKKKKKNSLADDDDSLYEPSMETSSYNGCPEWTNSSYNEGPQVKKDEHGDGHISDGNNCPKSVPCLSNRRFRVEEEVEVLSRAASFETTNPFFIVLMQPSYVQCPYALNIPAAFFMTHISKTSGNGFMKLHGSSGRVWIARYHLGMYNAKPKVRAQGGWKTFVLDNKLQKGDACVFELLTSGKALFKVVIYRGSQCSSCGCSSSTTRNDTEPIKNQTKDPIKYPIEEKTKEAQRSGRVQQRPSDAPAEAQVKRGRGRPRKTQLCDKKTKVIGARNERRPGRPRRGEKVKEKAR
ncbi:B3 domain-containing transcription factor VRN1-like isoform X4 [Rhodamnia argentea]|uniref:B3 domain-containing transcription factor VRN1-like isoform X4 n=1 Tax=Rhodamnia argentea TaxID=178133 RepID=A0ABM3HS27_9MYRT|nr:B3 domain-containing transcription factor VRN1-like isoform X4 [Rhodamnia argentea]